MPSTKVVSVNSMVFVSDMTDAPHEVAGGNASKWARAPNVIVFIARIRPVMCVLAPTDMVPSTK